METSQNNVEEFDIFEKTKHTVNRNLNGITIPWVDKYRPKTIDDMVIDEGTRKLFKDMIASKDISSMTLFGPPGIGKTTLAKILSRSIDAEELFIKCGTEGTVDVVRDRIEPFCESISSGRVKCIILDEFDSASGGSAANNGMQKSLRSLMEAFPDTRFIITCNYQNKIIPEMFSRCKKYNIGFAPADVAKRLVQIWKQEGITYDKATATKFFKTYVVPKLPDIRMAISLAQDFTRSGTLDLSYADSQTNTSNSVLSDYAMYIINTIKSGVDFKVVRHDILCNTLKFNGDYQILISALTDAIINQNLNTELIPLMANYAYKMSQVTDPSLQMIGAILSMYKYIKNTK